MSRRIRIGISHRGAGLAPVFAAIESGALTAAELVPDLVELDGHAAALAALKAGEVDVINSVGPEVLMHNARHGGTARIVASAISRTAVEIMVHPDWPQTRPLCEARWGVLRRFDPDHVTALQVFQLEGWPEQALDLRVAPEGGSRFDRLLRPKFCDAVILHSPDPILACNLGWRTALDTARYDAPMQNSCAATSRAVLAERPDLIEAYLRAYIQGVWRFRSEPDFGTSVVRTTCPQLTPEAARQSWFYFAQVFGGVMFPSRAGLAKARDILADLGALDPETALPMDPGPMERVAAAGGFAPISGIAT